jgi:ectoine hydroxylase-related dioxygenase (phytanoyl-CoA dioxygenase family)
VIDHSRLTSDGYSVFKGLIPHPLVTAASLAIEHDLSTNFDPARQLEYDNQSYCPAIIGSPDIMNLVFKSPVYSFLDELFGINKVWIGKGQIAIRRAHNHPDRIPPTPHLDGFASGLNGVPPDTIYNHTALVGVFLTPVQRQFAGNFTVWPGSQNIYEVYFRKRGRRALREAPPDIDVGEPLQLMCDVGDVVLAHYEVGHTAAVNTADSDRIAVFFRVVLRDVERDRWRYLANIWDGWRLTSL